MEYHGVMMWNWRVIIVVPDSSKADAERVARDINSTGPAYDGDAFTVSLSESGAGSPTHWALYTSATDEMISSMSLALPNIDGAKYWRHDIAGHLISSNVTDPQGQPWSFEDSIGSIGLRPVSTMPA